MNRIVALVTATIFIFLQFSCKYLPGGKKIVQSDDYKKYLQSDKTNKSLHKIDEEIDFWNKRLEKTPDDIISQTKIAGLLTSRFQYSGNIKEIIKADSLYKIANQLNKVNSSGTYRSLATNCITRHQFQKAKLYVDSALKLGDDKYVTLLIQFDVAMELGDYRLAKQLLQELGNKNRFEYLIREAKYKDHVEGNLDEAIILMERAFEKIKETNNVSLYCWTKSNLGDLYSHANQFKQAYQSYLNVLAIDPAYYHCLKGIAWLAFSHDKNTTEAKLILKYLKEQHPVPDYDLLLAEIADYEYDTIAMKQYLSLYTSATQNGDYGDMYNKYNFNLAADEFSNYDEAFAIAQTEVNNRPTPESYHQLAWIYFKKGDLKKANEISNTYVINRCFEPEVLYRTAIIYQNNGKTKKAIELMNMANESAFELGPAISKKIDIALKNG
jgi:tetratricopeptide (TPR) repeat protein